ncbi:MAG: hypothetical protein IKK57_12115 [Clostridia bacterium]|nr:hypothetical protein [Clostridia bacterium]
MDLLDDHLFSGLKTMKVITLWHSWHKKATGQMKKTAAEQAAVLKRRSRLNRNALRGV